MFNVNTRGEPKVRALIAVSLLLHVAQYPFLQMLKTNINAVSIPNFITLQQIAVKYEPFVQAH